MVAEDARGELRHRASTLHDQKKDDEAIKRLHEVIKAQKATAELRAKSMLLLGKIHEANGRFETGDRQLHQDFRLLRRRAESRRRGPLARRATARTPGQRRNPHAHARSQADRRKPRPRTRREEIDAAPNFSPPCSRNSVLLLLAAALLAGGAACKKKKTSAEQQAEESESLPRRSRRSRRSRPTRTLVTKYPDSEFAPQGAGAARRCSARCPRRRRAEEEVTRAERAAAVCDVLARTYPDAHCELDYTTPLELLVATILSAQCTDKRVNIVTKELFRVCRTRRRLRRAARRSSSRSLIQTTGFFRAKAKNIRACCAALVERHGGEVPRTMEELHALAGVGRKTANVVLGNAFDINVGVVVDTHVQRLSHAPRPDETDRPREDRAGPDEAHPARRSGRSSATGSSGTAAAAASPASPTAPAANSARICPSADKVGK